MLLRPEVLGPNGRVTLSKIIYFAIITRFAMAMFETTFNFGEIYLFFLHCLIVQSLYFVKFSLFSV